MAAVSWHAWLYVGGRVIGQIPVPVEALAGRPSPEGLEVYIVIGAPDHAMAAGSVRLAFDHGFPPREGSSP